MIKEHKNLAVLTSLLLLLPIFAGCFLWNSLPAEMPIHFNASGVADNYASKSFAVILLPLLMLGIHLLTLFLVSLDPKVKNIQKKPIILLFWVIPVVFLPIQFSLLYYGVSGGNFQTSRIVMAVVGLLFLILGNYLPKCGRNYSMGLKLPWTLDNAENWNKTHRLAGKLFFLSGVLFLLVALFGGSLNGTIHFALIMALLILTTIVPSVYSYLLYRKMQARK